MEFESLHGVWALPGGSKRYHFFSYGRSECLCGAHGYPGDEVLDERMTSEEGRPDNCPVCARLHRAKQAAWGAKRSADGRAA